MARIVSTSSWVLWSDKVVSYVQLSVADAKKSQLPLLMLFV